VSPSASRGRDTPGSASAGSRGVVVSRFGVPDLGIGVGFRLPHYREVTENQPRMDWFEVISENFMVAGGAPRHHLERLRAAYPVIPHGVAMNLGGPVDRDHLERLAALVAEIQPPWVSDHLCWNGTEAIRAHDLLPVPYTPQLRDHLIDRIQRVQERLGRPFAIENVSSYLTYRASAMDEWDFVAEIADKADCAILLDVNNVYVSAMNHGFDPIRYLDAIPADRVVQIHLAGHTVKDEGYRLDTHDSPVCDAVWDLYAHAIGRTGSVSTLIEWDEHIPTFERLTQEADAARKVRDEALIRHGDPADG
jgi:uncharacterized protein (UPF0276 family)